VVMSDLNKKWRSKNSAIFGYTLNKSNDGTDLWMDGIGLMACNIYCRVTGGDQGRILVDKRIFVDFEFGSFLGENRL
jgi:hypothetical protein